MFDDLLVCIFCKPKEQRVEIPINSVNKTVVLRLGEIENRARGMEYFWVYTSG